MPCENGQIQIGIDPNTSLPICMEQQVAGQAQTGVGSSNPAWGQVLNTLPGVLSGVADIVGASKGKPRPDSTIVMQQPIPMPSQQQRSSPWIWIILLVVLVFVVLGMVLFRKKVSS